MTNRKWLVAFMCSSHVAMVVVFRFIGFAMVIMIAMIIRMKIKKDVHQHYAVLISSVALIDDNVSHSKITVMDNKIATMDQMKKAVCLRFSFFLN